jgi:hypothetical protein
LGTEENWTALQTIIDSPGRASDFSIADTTFAGEDFCRTTHPFSLLDIEPSAPAAEFHTYNDSASSTVETLRPDCWAARYNAARTPFWFSPNDAMQRALPFGKRSNSASIAATASLCFPLRVREPIAVGRVQLKGKYNDPLNAIQNVLYRTLWLS